MAERPDMCDILSAKCDQYCRFRARDLGNSHWIIIFYFNFININIYPNSGNKICDILLIMPNKYYTEELNHGV